MTADAIDPDLLAGDELGQHNPDGLRPVLALPKPPQTTEELLMEIYHDEN